MRRTILGLVLLAPLFAAPAVMAQAQQGPDRKPEGNLGAGAAMTGAERQSSGLPPTGGGMAAPMPQTTSPRNGSAATPSR